jgi:DNA-binding CsgD family transcriptional regulator/tetratricopeptide (TPR) repeat protein
MNGREEVLAPLAGHFDSGVNTRESVVFLAGEPGIGKTWLLDQAAARLGVKGATILRGGAVDAEGMPPYLLFVGALGAYVKRASRDAVRRQAGHGARTLNTIVPELELKLTRLPIGMQLPPEQARLRLYEAVGDFLIAIATDAPLALIMDDLQWADSATLDLLTHVARQARAAPIIFLGAYRPGEAADNPAFERTVAELTRQRLLVDRMVGPMSDGEVKTLVEGHLVGGARDDLVRRVIVASEGNPFVAEELLRSWTEIGALVREDNGWRLLELAVDPIPSGILVTLGHRIGRLEPSTAAILRVASVIGRSFRVPILAAILNETNSLVEARLQAASRAHIIREAGTGTFRFAHDTIRECLYQHIGLSERAQYHEAIGIALEGEPREESSQRLAGLAFHFARSPDTARGVRYSCEAADRAWEEYAFREAMMHCEEALRLLPHDAPRRGQLLIRFAEAAQLAEFLGKAVEAYTSARAWFEARGDRASAALASHGLGLTYWRQEALAEAQQALEAARILCDQRLEPEAVRILADLADLRGSSLSQYQAGLDLAEQALAMSRRLGEQWQPQATLLQAAALRTVGKLHVLSNDLTRGLPILEEALEMLLNEDQVVDACECCAALANAYHWSGQSHRSLQLTNRRVLLAEAAHDVYQLRHVHSWSIFMATCLGNWPLAEAAHTLQMGIVERLPGHEPEAFLHVCRGYYLYHRNRYDKARESLTRGLTMYGAFGTESLAWHLGLLGLVDLAVGDFRAAQRCLDEQETLIAALPEQNFQRGCALATMSLTAAGMRDIDRAVRYYPLLSAFAGLNFWFLVDRALGALALCLGRYDSAYEHLEVTRAATNAANLMPELARTLVLQAELAALQGGSGSGRQARDLIAQASGIFGELAMRAELAGARDLLRRIPTQPGPPRTQNPAGLSLREVSVLRLVSEGKTNREIAGELALSEKTVANHITSILNKTGTDNRTAAAAFAMRRGLAR